jgi:hypothetical protein
MKANSENTPECIAYNPAGAAAATGRSRSRIFLAIKNRELVARKDGRATLLEASELRRWVQSLPTVGGGPTEDAAA